MSSAVPSLTVEIASQLLLRDRQRLQQMQAKIQQRQQRKQPTAREQAQFEQCLQEAQQRYQQRTLNWPQPEYDEQLPIVQARAQIAEAIRDHQVVVIAGETGSGKTTQIPKICLELGRGKQGLIGHTQPRRLAATSVARRVAQELKVTLGEQVGYAIRFDQKVNEQSLIAVMTDGVLLQELKNDPLLLRYDTLIIDEAHERSLNIDLLLGYLKPLLLQRPELKLIITSATIDPESFSRFFQDAPVLSVSGRTYPVDVWYQPLLDKEEDVDRQLAEGVANAIDSCWAHGPGDVMVFLSGEAEIREVSHFLRKQQWKNVEILPLYARLSMADQQRVFSSSNQTRVVLATNVAETSLTVPGIRYVVDSGLARISRYSQSSRVQRLPIEPISQASANQRKGRCGRVMSGICVRLYSERDFLSRPEFSTPEILRTNLSALLLQMLALGITDVEGFEFLDAPDRKLIKDGLKLLEELSAINEQRQLTVIGRKMSHLPLPPQLSRILIAAEQFAVVNEALIITAFLCIRDPRERPAEKADQAVGLHRRFIDPESDFVAILNLWRHLHERKAELSANAWRKEMKAEFLNVVAVLEWGRLVAQLRTMAHEVGLQRSGSGTDYEALHKTLLAGFIHQIGQATREGDYQGARHIRFQAHSGSGLHKKMKPWVVAADFLDSHRLYGLHLAKVEPLWIEQLAGHLLKHSYGEPHWREKQGDAAVNEQVTLFGLVIVPRRATPLAKTNPALAQEMFVRHALVRRESDLRASFLQHNQQLIDTIHEQEEKARRRDLLAAEEDLVALLLPRLPAEVVDKHSLIRALKRNPKLNQLLMLTEREVRQAGQVADSDYPPELQLDGMLLPLKYSFAPGEEYDGITVQLSVAQLMQLQDSQFERLVPGLLPAKLEALLRNLPKDLRKTIQPINDTLQYLLPEVLSEQIPLLQQLESLLYQRFRIRVAMQDWQLEQLPAHLLMRFEVLDEQGKVLTCGRSITELQQRLGQRQQQVLRRQARSHEQTGLLEFPDEPLAERIDSGGTQLFLALKDEIKQLSVRAFPKAEEAAFEHRQGLARLLMFKLETEFKSFQKQNRVLNPCLLAYANLIERPIFLDDWFRACVLDAMPECTDSIRSRESFQQLLSGFSKPLRIRLADHLPLLTEIGQHASATLKQLKALEKTAPDAAEDIRDQLQYLLAPGFISRDGLPRLPHIKRYVQAMQWRAERVAGNVPQDAARMQRWHQALMLTERALEPEAPLWSIRGQLQRRLQDLLNEYSVALFAQHLGTAETVSEKRLQQMVEELTSLR
ncbi:ATP-dependent RNA helicase HrpA [Permianibacter aggregans]|uniref:ATP-dependent helicase HrpA n=1 Tax=Permianibacter aggregans TaxID=1510150 RepID=A0A4R6UVI2_9GAMM|nr:ATP-dependent RNA helicase HrpA [Permianibacter aggregans]QGX41440.1 ATP-dependent RNA helicase HrpA [Permianibacter aggregans]TDQ51231.1 ATP-dependent helicase HrpA [Permianibacter aggregans]